MAGRHLVRRIRESFLIASRNPSPEAGPSRHVGDVVDESAASFNRFLQNELDEDYHRLVATSFARYIKGDSDARTIDVDDVLHFFGYKQKVKAVELLLKLYPNTKPVLAENGDESIFSGSGKNIVGRKKTIYLISFDQFEELLLAAQTPEGTTARKAVLAVKKAVFKFIKMEKAQAQKKLEEKMSELALAEQDNAMLSTQLKNLRDAKSYLYAFHLFDDRYKCGITDNPEKREKQHRTSCPSGRMVHTVAIACKQSEKLLDSIMKGHGNHVKQEEYEIQGGEDRIALVLNTIARVEETLHAMPFDDYDRLLSCVEGLLDRFSSRVREENKAWEYEQADAGYEYPQSGTNSSQQVAAENNPFAMFVARNVVRSDAKYAHFTAKEAKDSWKMQESEYGKTPKEEEIRQRFAMLLRVPCLKRFFVPAEFASEYTVKSGEYKPCSVFCGFRLVVP